MERKLNRPLQALATGPGLGLYVAAVGAAASTTFFDRVRNGEVSAMRKTGLALREMVESADVTSGTLSLIALVIFCVVAAFMVYVYRPREPKEAFVLGLGVLAAVGMTVSPPKTTELHTDGIAAAPVAAPPGHLSSLGWADRLFAWVPSAEAQAQVSPQSPPPDPARTDVWVYVDGPPQLRTAESRVLIFSLQTKAIVVNAPAYVGFYLPLPPGSYQFEISHVGYRSVVFPVQVGAAALALQVPMSPADMDLLNFFGPSRAAVKPRPDWAQAFTGARQACGNAGRGAGTGASKALLAGVEQRVLHAMSPEARRLLCA